MIRTIIEIDEEACGGCGLCVSACHEGALAVANGKARLVRDDYCDGLGDCLPTCPAGAITFVERDAANYDEEAVKAAQASRAPSVPAVGGCPGSLSRFFAVEPAAKSSTKQGKHSSSGNPAAPEPRSSELVQWPVEIKLVPAQAPYFDNADVLVAADCTAFAYADFHRDFMRGKTTVIGCPKLDAVDYADKLTEILASNNVASVTVARMEVPCCGGLETAVRTAVSRSGKDVRCETAVISTRGEVLDRR